MESLPSWAILKIFEFLHPFSRPLRKLKKLCFAELNTKSLFTTISNVLPSKFKCWPQKFCRVKLIPWNLVKSHLYVLLPGNFHFYNKVNAIGQWENHNYLLVFAHTVKHIYSCQKFQVLDILGHQICQEIEKNLNISKL